MIAVLKFFARAGRGILAGIGAFGAGLSGVMVGDVGVGDITQSQWLVISLLAWGTAMATWGFVNPKV